MAALLLITVAMGMLDAIGLLHFGTFTGYMTGTIILIGINVARGSALALPPLLALGALVAGAVVGGRLVRRRHPPPRLVGDTLGGVAALVALAALLAGFGRGDADPGIIVILGVAMGLQTSATRYAGVPDMTMPAATMVLHGLAHDSRIAGGRGERSWRRVGVLASLLIGAGAGTALSTRHVWIGLAATAGLILAACLVLRSAEKEPSAGTASALPEVGGDAARYFDPASPEQIGDVLGELLADRRQREIVRDAGLRRAAHMTWRATADATLESYRRAWAGTKGT